MAGRRKALIIASDEYEQPELSNLRAPAADAETLGRVLGDPQIGDFAVQVVRNQPSHIIQMHIDDLFADCQADDVLLLHFSCHGIKNQSGELFFAATNTRISRLASTAVSAQFVDLCMRQSISRRIVLFLDCCYGGAFSRSAQVRASGDAHVLDSFLNEEAPGRGRAVITASSAIEYAYEGGALARDDRRRPSVFTAALVEGLATGDADRDQDGWISLNELYDYLFAKVRERNPHQTPNCQFELQGELYLAKSRHRRFHIYPSMPADLGVALADSNMYTRLGAISALRSQLFDDDLSTAIDAYELLTEIAGAEIRTIAGPAEAALAEAALTVSQDELDFGRIEEGTAAPWFSTLVLGPAIARDFQFRVSHDWIRVHRTVDALEISLDTRGSGLRQGSVALTGPMGEAVIGIYAELTPPRDVTVSIPVGQPAMPDREAPAPAKLAAAPAERAEAPVKKAAAPAERAEATIGRAEAPTKRIASLAPDPLMLPPGFMLNDTKVMQRVSAGGTIYPPARNMAADVPPLVRKPSRPRLPVRVVTVGLGLLACWTVLAAWLSTEFAHWQWSLLAGGLGGVAILGITMKGLTLPVRGSFIATVTASLAFMFASCVLYVVIAFADTGSVAVRLYVFGATFFLILAYGTACFRNWLNRVDILVYQLLATKYWRNLTAYRRQQLGR